METIGVPRVARNARERKSVIRAWCYPAFQADTSSRGGVTPRVPVPVPGAATRLLRSALLCARIIGIPGAAAGDGANSGHKQAPAVTF